MDGPITNRTKQVPAIRMVNEAHLIALAVEVSTGVLVDIGESGLSVTPIYDGCPVAPAVRFEPCGGADVTKFLDYMLLSRTNEQFNQMVRCRGVQQEFFFRLCLLALCLVFFFFCSKNRQQAPSASGPGPSTYA